MADFRSIRETVKMFTNQPACPLCSQRLGSNFGCSYCSQERSTSRKGWICPQCNLSVSPDKTSCDCSAKKLNAPSKMEKR